MSSIPRLNLSKTSYIPLAVTAGILAFTYFYPIWLIDTLGKENPWTSYLYLYAFGFITFFIGIYIALKQRACVLGRGRDTKWFLYLMFGLAFFAGLHAIWIYLSLNLPYKGF